MWHKFIIACAGGWLLMAAAFAQEQMPQKFETGGDCSACHFSDSPSLDDLIPDSKCRRPRSREKLDEVNASPPDVVIMDQLSDIYVPVAFPHARHAEMGEMGGGCSVCHHHGQEGKIVSCRTCHENTAAPPNLRQPGLKGAYHRQCLSCHREWSHNTDCSACHIKRTTDPNAKDNHDPTDIPAVMHRNVEVPVNWVYPTPELEEGTMVTFHHKDHVEQFGNRCVDCHQKENCSRCHDAAKPIEHVRQDPHEDCAKCHEMTDDCGTCHKDHESPSFDHAKRTPLMWKAFHTGVSCQGCHVEGKFAIGQKVCQDCHAADWYPTGFDHAKTALVLNETHRDIDCAGCHPNGLGQTLDCSGCHDDKKFPPDVPGERITPAPEPVAKAEK